jgi:glycine oxidase
MRSSATADVVVIGGGIIGMATARALASRGVSVLLSAPELPGGATSAAGGILAPTIDPMPGAAFAFGRAARDCYPAFAESLLEETGINVELARDGVLRLAFSEREAADLSADSIDDATWLPPEEVARLEPSLAACAGAMLHKSDAIVANEKVHSALRSSIRRSSSIRWTSHPVGLVDAASMSVTLADNSKWEGGRLVLAAGAWSTGIPGLAPLPVEPARGQMITFRAMGVRRAAFGADGYVVPRRDGRVLVGSTMERVGFDPSVTVAACERLRSVASSLIPALGAERVLDSWSGLRPMTPDGLPIIGADTKIPGLLLATGHSKNGILLGPLTAEVIADLVTEGSTSHDIVSFAPDRFKESI